MDPDRKADLMRLGVKAALMRELLHTPMWESYAALLTEGIDENIHRMILGTKDEFEYRKGVVTALRQALATPELVIQQAEVANRN